MVEEGYAPFTHFVWSDGCANQFKSHKPWYFGGCYPNLIGGCVMIWSFFGMTMGKEFMIELGLLSSGFFCGKNN
jgi:hypothetical protein